MPKVSNHFNNSLKANLVTRVCDENNNGKINIISEIKLKISKAHPEKGTAIIDKMFNNFIKALKLSGRQDKNNEINNIVFSEAVENYLNLEEHDQEVLNVLDLISTIMQDKLKDALSKLIIIKPGKDYKTLYLKIKEIDLRVDKY